MSDWIAILVICWLPLLLIVLYDVMREEILDWTMISTVVIAIATCAGVCVAAFQWKALRSTDEKVGRQLVLAETEQRPWLKLQKIAVPQIQFSKPTESFSPGELRADIRVTIKNIGKTPANHVDLIPLILVNGENTRGEDQDAVRKILRQRLLSTNPSGRFNRFLFPEDSFDAELPVQSSAMALPGAVDFRRSENERITIQIFVGVRYRFADKTGFTIWPIQILDQPEPGGRVRFQLAVMKEQSPATYHVGQDYVVVEHWQGVEAE